MMQHNSAQQQQQLYPPVKKHRNFNRRCCLIAVGAVLVLVFLLSIIFLILALTVFKPKQPRTQIQSAKVDGFAPRLSFPNIDFQLNITLDLQILVENRNHASFKHGAGKSFLFYQGNQVGETDIYPGLVRAMGSTTLPCRLTLEVDKLADNLNRLIRDVIGGKLVMETRTKIPGSVNFLKIFKKHIEATSDCRFTIGFPDMKVQNQECKNKAKL
ncbi:hypothetical protein JRO89_XS12G0250900 [Xanthoceras sorbifolium]|uniref:Late embryogenesis abundant protein LEA-2 subgroup domain-containing protein n=1 Tax=Xanthoceras sorbifolium TaxID=99658 RepID=A0ABQ8HDN9_9ROSI|nr:hypothetical protein JRO89_XS12G0250900 [Xanthoceras sorbifolium]